MPDSSESSPSSLREVAEGTKGVESPRVNSKGLPFIDDEGKIDKKGVREYASRSLTGASDKIKGKAGGLRSSETVSKNLTDENNKNKTRAEQALDRLLALSTNAGQWNTDNFSTETSFDTKILEKALEYQGDGTPEQNYFDALGNRYDQAVAAQAVFDKLAKDIEGIQDITEEQKKEAAHYLFEKIRNYGDRMKTEEDRQKLLAGEFLSEEDKTAGMKIREEDLDAILDAGLIEGAVKADGTLWEPKYAKAFINSDGSRDDAKYEQAVLRAAAGMLENQFVGTLEGLGATDLAREIYLKAIEIHQKRLSPKEPTSSGSTEPYKAAMPLSDPLSAEPKPASTPRSTAGVDAGEDPLDPRRGLPIEKRPDDGKPDSKPADGKPSEGEGDKASAGDSEGKPADETAGDDHSGDETTGSTELSEDELKKLKDEMETKADAYIKAKKTARSWWRNLVSNYRSWNKKFAPFSTGNPENRLDAKMAKAREEYVEARNKYISQRAVSERPQITKAAKDKLAYDIQKRIREYGKAGQFATEKSRQELITARHFTQDEMTEILKSNLVIGEDINNIKFNKEGFEKDDKSDEKKDELWDKAVFEVASRLLEADYRKELSGKAAGILLDEMKRFSEKELTYNERTRVLRFLNKLYRNPLVRAGVGYGITGGIVLSGATGNLPLAAILGGLKVAWAAIGTEGLLHKGQDFYSGRNGARKEQSKESVQEMKLDEIKNSEASWHEDNMRKGHQNSETQSILLTQYGVEVGKTIQDYLTENGTETTGDTYAVAADILEKALAAENANAKKDEALQWARRAGAKRWGAAIATTLASAGLLSELIPHLSTLTSHLPSPDIHVPIPSIHLPWGNIHLPGESIPTTGGEIHATGGDVWNWNSPDQYYTNLHDQGIIDTADVSSLHGAVIDHVVAHNQNFLSTLTDAYGDRIPYDPLNPAHAQKAIDFVANHQEGMGQDIQRIEDFIKQDPANIQAHVFVNGGDLVNHNVNVDIPSSAVDILNRYINPVV